MSIDFTRLEKWALQEFSTQAGGAECQQILVDWFWRLRKQIDPATAEYGQFISEAVKILEGVRAGIAGVFRLEEITRGRGDRPSIWAWPTETQVEKCSYLGSGTVRAGLDDLDLALAAYLKRPLLQCDAIDVSAINALLVPELADLIFAIKSGAAVSRPNWGFIFGGGNVVAQMGSALLIGVMGFLGRWAALPVIAVVLANYSYYQGAAIVAAVWGLYVLYRIFTIPARLRLRGLRIKAGALAHARYSAIMQAWQAARGSTINPTRLKELVLAAEERGAIFPAALHIILDRAIKRDATALIRPRVEIERVDRELLE